MEMQINFYENTFFDINLLELRRYGLGIRDPERNRSVSRLPP